MSGPGVLRPPVRPIPEYRADAGLTAVYEDLKRTLGVPWVGVVVQALAHYRPFFEHAYAQLRPTLESQYFERVTAELRLFAWQEMSERFRIAGQSSALRAECGYSERELAQIADVLGAFEYGNPKYFVIATAALEGLTSGDTLGGVPPRDPADLLPRPPVTAAAPTPTMLEEHHVDGSLRVLYDDIKSTLDLPFVNSDYKAMARWPTYLGHAWRALKPVLDTEPYRDVRLRLDERCAAAVRDLPFPYRCGPEELRGAGMSREEIAELTDVARLFQSLLSGLILNVTHFRLGLGDS